MRQRAACFPVRFMSMAKWICRGERQRVDVFFKALHSLTLAATFAAAASLHSAPPPTAAFVESYCAKCHNDIDKEGGFDLTSLAYTPADPVNFQQWVKVHDRLQAGEMPPKDKKRPDAAELETFVQSLAATLSADERAKGAREGRATQRRLNGYEYENALRDLLNAPWLQVKGQFPDDGEAHRFNKIGDALDVSHVHMLRYMSAADYAIRQVLSVQLEQPPTTTTRHYARDQRTLTGKYASNIFNTSPDRMTYPVIGSTAQPEVRYGRAPATVGEADPKTRELEAVGWVSSNYVTGFTYRWDGFRAPVAGRYRVRFSGYTLWAAPGGTTKRFANEQDKVGTSRPPNPSVPDYDQISPGRRNEPITVYTRNGIMNRRVGEFDLTPEPTVYDIGEVWLLANETLVPDASRLYRSRPNNFKNPLMTPEGAPSVAFRWMEVDGPLYDDSTAAGYRLLFGDLPLKKVASGGVALGVIARGDRREGGREGGRRIVPLEESLVEVVSKQPRQDAERLFRTFLSRAYRRPVVEPDVQRFVALFDDRTKAGLSFTEAMIATYTAVLASPGFVFLDEKPGRLDDYALATRLALFLSNSEPDATLRARATRGELSRPEVLRAETERLLADKKSRRFVDAFLDYWIDTRKIEDTTPSTTLYNDYYLDDALTEAALAETQFFFADLLQNNLPARNIVDSNYTFLNERLALHYGLTEVKGASMRRVTLPPDSPRGGLLTQASVLKITANGTTTSPVLRGRWIVERILGLEISPPPASVVAVEPDIRGAVTIRQQLEKHRDEKSCAACHSKMDPPGFALESFDIMGAWRDRYRAVDADKPAEKGLGKNGQPFEYHFGLPVDSAGELPDGRPFANIREFKQLLRDREVPVARNLAKQLVVYATGAPVRFSDRADLEKILQGAKAHDYGVRSLVHGIVQSDLFRNK
ncbi:MAG: DUF1592 domain-containing protein [Opitutus sp.]|nr:DUF1592 domain-containing protein [Opitutus sp.]